MARIIYELHTHIYICEKSFGSDRKIERMAEVVMAVVVVVGL